MYNNKSNAVAANAANVNADASVNANAIAAAAAAERKVGFKPAPPKGPKRGSQGPPPADRQTMAGTVPPPQKSQAPINARVPNRKSAPGLRNGPEIAQRPGIVAQLVS